MKPEKAIAHRPVELAKATRPLPPVESAQDSWRKELRFMEKRIAATVLTLLVPIVCLGWNVFVEHKLEEERAIQERKRLSEEIHLNQVRLEQLQDLVQETAYQMDRDHDDLLEIDEIFRQERQTKNGKHRVLPRRE
jgi:hypothetical protein